MFLRALPKRLFNTDRLRALATSPVSNLLIKKCFLKSSLNLLQLQITPTHLISISQGEEISTSYPTLPPQKPVESNKVTPQVHFISTWQTQSSQHLTGHSFQPFHSFVAIFWTHSRTFMSFLKCRLRPAHNTQVRPEQQWTQRDNHLSGEAGYAPGCGFLVFWPAVPDLFLQSCFPATLLPIFIFIWCYSTMGEESSFVLVTFHPFIHCPLLQSSWTPLQGFLSLKRVHDTSQHH